LKKKGVFLFGKKDRLTYLFDGREHFMLKNKQEITAQKVTNNESKVYKV